MTIFESSNDKCEVVILQYVGGCEGRWVVVRIVNIIKVSVVIVEVGN